MTELHAKDRFPFGAVRSNVIDYLIKEVINGMIKREVIRQIVLVLEHILLKLLDLLHPKKWNGK